LLACVGALGWLMAGDHSRNGDALDEVALLITRYVLAAELLRQGMSKVLPTGVVPPDAVDWVRPWGEFEKCELVRLSLGYPPIYVLFLGLCETVAGVLLLLRRTTSLGAIIAAVAMTNVMMLGSCYCGATAGIYPAAYVALAAFLIVADRCRLLSFFLFGKPIAPPSFKPRWPTSPHMRYAGVALKALVVAWLVYSDGYFAIRLWTDYGYMSSLRGVDRVENFTPDQTLVPPLNEPPKRWLVVAIGNFADRVAIRGVDGAQINLAVKPALAADEPGWRRERAAQTAKSTGTLAFIEIAPVSTATSETVTISYARVGSDRLVLAVRFRGGSLTAKLRRMSNDSFAFYKWLWRK
jgi:uncharacterized membrane protein YphA (DoxX/SURF4 family)